MRKYVSSRRVRNVMQLIYFSGDSKVVAVQNTHIYDAHANFTLRRVLFGLTESAAC